MSYSFLTNKTKPNKRLQKRSNSSNKLKDLFVSTDCSIKEEEEEEFEIEEEQEYNENFLTKTLNKLKINEIDHHLHLDEKLTSYNEKNINESDENYESKPINEFKSLEEKESKIPIYKLRADNNNNNNDWIRAPSYFDEQQLSELTNEQIQFTLDYFILSGYRVSQMTKTYNDIEAVTKLLDEKEKDLELAATIGKQLLEKDQELEAKIEYLELQLEKTTEMVNQLRHDINLKDNLLKTFLDCESDSSSYSLNDSASEATNNKKLNNKHFGNKNDQLNEYKKQIADLQDENDLLRDKADYFEKETFALESKESTLLENCFRELELSQTALFNTQDELKAKSELCSNQQEDIQNLFSQIFELQLTIKNLTKDNSELQTVYDNSTIELVNQLNEMKEKYNNCLNLLNKTQDELIMLRKKHASIKQRTSASKIACDDDYDDDVIVNNKNNLLLIKTNNNNSSNHWMPPPANSNSLATEVFCSLAKDYQAKNLSLSKQTSQSSEFIKKVKQKLIKQIPGSNLDSCLQSDSEIDSMNLTSPLMNSSINYNNGINSFDFENAILNGNQSYYGKFTNCPTPESIFSTGSASVYSQLIGRSCSFQLPEKLKIVKPIEGSYTLKHWQHLARPNLGCLFESRPGISVKGNSLDLGVNFKCSDDETTKFNDDYDDDDGIYDEEEGEEEEENEELRNNFLIEQQDFNKSNNKKFETLKLSPSRVEFLSKLLENEENSTNKEEETTNITNNNNNNKTTENNFFYGMFKKYFKNETIPTSKQLPPDTPPSSPVNTPPPPAKSYSTNILYDVFESAKLKCTSTLSSYFIQPANAPTPPGTPFNELEDELEYEETTKLSNQTNFFEQIVNKLNIFSFKSVSTTNNNNNNSNAEIIKSNPILKPIPIYVKKINDDDDDVHDDSMIENVFKLEEEYTNNNDDDNNELNLDKEIDNELIINLKTPPSSPRFSPSKFSPPLNYDDDDDDNDANYDHENRKKQLNNSAFVRVASLNPFINKSVDLASLLGTISSLKRNQRLCKYY